MSDVGNTGTPLPGPGWYQDASGALRWWDGRAWGPAAPVKNTSVDVWRLVAIFCHLGTFIFLLVGAIALRVMAGSRDRFTKHHTNEALNAQIWFVVVWIACVLTFMLARNDWGALAYCVMLLSMTYIAVFSTLGAVRAHQGRYWRYPLPFRFTRGSVRGPAPDTLPTAAPTPPH